MKDESSKINILLIHTMLIGCTGLKTNWKSKIETATKFPVDPGTVVEVTCSDQEAINLGSSEVTCSFETYFTYQHEPQCSKAGKFIAVYNTLR